jgi:G3E family GTPase
MNSKISKVPTNIITGFLGVGKTSAILNLLKDKPENERWAVLVNEFGEIGIDGSLFSGQHSENSGVFIKEVPGGCMCCVAGLPMQVALNELLSRAKPDRLLIEPTGLGHPLEILEILSDKFYKQILQVEKIVTLVDARKVSDERYTNHDTFNQQIMIADLVVGNKYDLYQTGDLENLRGYVQKIHSREVEVSSTQQGRIDPQWLKGKTLSSAKPDHHEEHGHEEHSHQEHSHEKHSHEEKTNEDLSRAVIGEAGFVKAQNQGEGFASIGWRFDSSKTFNEHKLNTFLLGLNVERMKAAFITEQGIFGYNLTSDAMTRIELDECFESRIEIIAYKTNMRWEEELLTCIDSPANGTANIT